METQKDFTRFGKSKAGNFHVCDTVGVPHPYCITPRHVAYAADHCGGILSKDAIIGAESHGAKCDICKGELKFHQHEKALLVSCFVDFDEAKQELHEYLLSIKDMATAEGFAGFAFVKE